jgi:hypothetical protein
MMYKMRGLYEGHDFRSDIIQKALGISSTLLNLAFNNYCNKYELDQYNANVDG